MINKLSLNFYVEWKYLLQSLTFSFDIAGSLVCLMRDALASSLILSISLGLEKKDAHKIDCPSYGSMSFSP